MRCESGSGVNEQGDVLGELVGDGGEDVAAEGAQERAGAADAHEQGADVVCGGEVEDGVGDVAADDVDGNHGDILLAAGGGGGFEDGAGFGIFFKRRSSPGGGELDVELADVEDKEDALDLGGVGGGEIEEALAAAGGDHDVGA